MLSPLTVFSNVFKSHLCGCHERSLLNDLLWSKRSHHTKVDSASGNKNAYLILNLTDQNFEDCKLNPTLATEIGSGDKFTPISQMNKTPARNHTYSCLMSPGSKPNMTLLLFQTKPCRLFFSPKTRLCRHADTPNDIFMTYVTSVDFIVNGYCFIVRKA